jgi:hypothetical protein
VKLALDLIRRARSHFFLRLLSDLRQERFWRDPVLEPCVSLQLLATAP